MRVRILAEGDDEDEAEEYDITGSTEADMDMNRISDESPVGAALVGHKAGTKLKLRCPTATSSTTRSCPSRAASKVLTQKRGIPMPNQNPVNVASEREVRRQKLADLQAAGRDPIYHHQV